MNEMINKLLQQAADPDQAPIALTTLKSEIETMSAREVDLAAKLEEATNHVEELRESNHKLFLMQTGGSAENTEPEQTPDEVLESLILRKEE